MANGLRKVSKGAREKSMEGREVEKKKMNNDAGKILQERYIKGRKKRLESLKEEQFKGDIAQLIYDLREQAGLTQKEFAKRVNTTASVISRLESADYDGYSIKMLRRITESMHHRLELRFVPV